MSQERSVRYVDATVRDLSSPPWGSAMSTEDLAGVAGGVAESGAAVIEAVDADCARGALELRGESPWDRLRAVVREVGDVPVGIVASGRSLWGRTWLAPDLVRRFVLGAAESAVSRLRVFDPLNNAETLEPAATAAVEAGIVFVPTLILGPAPDPTDPRWLAECRALAGLPGASALCISDKAGHFGRGELGALVAAAAAATGLPIEVQIQAPGGLAPLVAVAAVEGGAGAVQASAGPVALVAARPSAETMRAALESGPRVFDCDRALVDRAARAVAPLLPPDRLRQAAAAVYGATVGLPPDLEAGLIWRLSRYGLSRRVVEAADEAGRIAADLGGLTLAHPLADAIVSQAARHVIDGERWSEIEDDLARAALGEYGALRGEVDPAALAAARNTRLIAADGPLDGAALRALDPPDGVSEEDLLLWAQFGDAATRLIRRRRSLGSETAEAGEPIGVDRGLIETLVDVVEGADDTEVTVELAGARVTVRRSGAPSPHGAAASGEEGDPGDEGLARVESPIVGTFYRAASPDAEPFVEEGSSVKTGDVLCLVEAMKLFNEIVVETDGIVRQICVENADAVEFGQLLFLIER